MTEAQDAGWTGKKQERVFKEGPTICSAVK